MKTTITLLPHELLDAVALYYNTRLDTRGEKLIPIDKVVITNDDADAPLLVVEKDVQR